MPVYIRTYNFPEPEEFKFLEKNQFYVYINHKPNGDPFYVGKGFCNRYCNDHSHNPWYENIVRKYGEDNIKTTILPVSSEKVAHKWEVEIIFLLRCQGFELVNLTDGGEGSRGIKWPDHARKAFSEQQLGRIVTPKTRALISKNNARVKWTDERRTSFSSKTTGHPGYQAKTPEALANQRDTRRGVKNTAEHNAKISVSKMGHPVSENTAKLIGAKNAANQHARINQTLIDTPWGIMGLYDASKATGVSWECFKDRYDNGFTPEKLFNPERNRSKGGWKAKTPKSQESRKRIGSKNQQVILNKNPLYHIEVLTPEWGRIKLYDLAPKIGVSWTGMQDRYKKNTSIENLTKPALRKTRFSNTIQ